MLTETESKHEDLLQEIAGHRLYIYNTHRQLLGFHPNNRDIADDLTQETLLKAIRFAEGFGHRCTLKSWLGRVARSTFFDYYRKRKRHSSISVLQEDLPNFVEPTSSVDHPDYYAIQNILLPRLDRLTSEQRSMVLLRSQGHSIQAISEALGGVPAGTVKSNLHRSYKKMAGPV